MNRKSGLAATIGFLLAVCGVYFLADFVCGYAFKYVLDWSDIIKGCSLSFVGAYLYLTNRK